jgi:hypothetical protein
MMKADVIERKRKRKRGRERRDHASSAAGWKKVGIGPKRCASPLPLHIIMSLAA